MIRIYYANIYAPFAGSCGSVYETRELADQMAARGRLACVRFTANVPQGPVPQPINSRNALVSVTIGNTKEPTDEPHRSV